MAGRKPKAKKVETPVVETPVVETPKVETPVVETPKVEAPKVETPKVETPKVETPKVETPKVETPKEMFLNAISKTPYTIYQNGIMICTYNTHLSIKAEEKYFEINFKKYSYSGIEIKYA